jgi:hypothetical protein
MVDIRPWGCQVAFVDRKAKSAVSSCILSDYLALSVSCRYPETEKTRLDPPEQLSAWQNLSVRIQSTFH